MPDLVDASACEASMFDSAEMVGAKFIAYMRASPDLICNVANQVGLKPN